MSTIRSFTIRTASLLMLWTAVASSAGCMANTVESEDEDVADTFTSFEEFEAQVYREPESGIYIVDGDTPIETREQLRDFYEQHILDGALAVHQSNGIDVKWTDAQKSNITYCVSTSFGANYDRVVKAMAAASRAWMRAANVNFVYVPAQDASCTAFNSNVVFDVRPTSGAAYLARAFFPNSARSNRNILIDATAFTMAAPLSLTGILRHELGHTLGFRHEHTRPEAGACFEDTNWRALTPYDSASVMHYPQCNGMNTWSLVLTNTDKAGAASLYGAYQPLGTLGPSAKLLSGFSLPGETAATGDFNGDGIDDVVTFTHGTTGDVYVALSDGSGFQTPALWHTWLAPGTEIPRIGDVNGDGMDDIVTFTRGDTGDVHVALSNGSGFGTVMKWHDWFAPWGEAPAVGDVNGDGKADIVTFVQGSFGYVYVALSNGSGFGGASLWHQWFAPWNEVPAVGDVNGDGKADIVTFVRGDTGDVYAALSNGSGFGGGTPWHDWFAPWNETPRLGDFNNDGKDDIVTFVQGDTGDVYAALSNGSGFGGATLRHDWFAPWNETPHTGDFNGDGLDDVITFTHNASLDVFVSFSQ